jgi:hypothetical protein
MVFTGWWKPDQVQLVFGGFMQRSPIRSIIFGLLLTMTMGSLAKAQYLFASFEGSVSDGFGSWNNGVVPFASDTTGSSYSYSSYGATNGVTALEVTDPNGYQQDLAFDFAANGDTSQFLANDVISFNVTSPPAGASTSGYWQVYQLFLNAPGAGFTQIGGAPLYNQYYYAGFGGATTTISVNYDAFKAAMTGNGYIQMILALNAGGGAPDNFYFDNFQLSSVPEPATLSVLALGAVGLLGRRRQRIPQR